MQSLPRYFLDNAKLRKDIIFCKDNNLEYTYSQTLDLLKKGVSFFTSKGINRERIVLFAERNVKSYLGILLIVFSNNCYIPINPELNDEKVSSIIKTSQANYQLVLGDEKRIEGLEYIEFSEAIKHKADLSLFNATIKDSHEEDELSIIYTSGSTGHPKGVVKSHTSMVNFVENFAQTFTNINEPLRIANQAPLFFDASSKDLFLNIYYGGSLYFPDKTDFALPNRIIDYMNDNQINFICWVPSAYTIIARLKALNFNKPQYLKYAFFVGEVLPRKYLNYWMNNLPDVYYCNLFGSSEIAGVCLYNHVSKVEEEDKPIPLGKPLSNNYVTLVNDEIVVSSNQVATCYVNDDADNSIFFVNEKGDRSLRTGDLGYFNEYNDLCFSSRKDFQIKHMGYRIELQEIELALCSLPFINQACCLFDNVKDKIIAVISLLEEKLEPEKLVITELKNKLAGYLIPNKVIVLESLPLNDNGKINRTELRKEYVG